MRFIMEDYTNTIIALTIASVVTTFLIPTALDILANVSIAIANRFKGENRFHPGMKYKKIVFPNGYDVANVSVHNVSFAWVHFDTDDGIVAVKKRLVKNLIRFV